MGADPVACAALAGGADVKVFFVRKEVKAHGLARRIEGPLLTRRGPLPRRRGRRQHGRLDDQGDRGAAGGGPRDLRRRQRARPADGRRRAHRGGRGRAVRRARRRSTTSTPSAPTAERRRSRAIAGRDARVRVEVDADRQQVGAHRAHGGGVELRHVVLARARVLAVEDRRGAACASAARSAGARADRPRCCARRPPCGPCSATIQNVSVARSRPLLTGVRRGSPLLRPVVSSSATAGTSPCAASALTGGLSSRTWIFVISRRLRSDDGIARECRPGARAPGHGSPTSGRASCTRTCTRRCRCRTRSASGTSRPCRCR